MISTDFDEINWYSHKVVQPLADIYFTFIERNLGVQRVNELMCSIRNDSFVLMKSFSAHRPVPQTTSRRVSISVHRDQVFWSTLYSEANVSCTRLWALEFSTFEESNIPAPLGKPPLPRTEATASTSATDISFGAGHFKKISGYIWHGRLWRTDADHRPVKVVKRPENRSLFTLPIIPEWGEFGYLEQNRSGYLCQRVERRYTIKCNGSEQYGVEGSVRGQHQILMGKAQEANGVAPWDNTEDQRLWE